MENPPRPRPFKKAEGSSGRLRPVSDPLESVGFPSKGDKTYYPARQVLVWARQH